MRTIAYAFLIIVGISVVGCGSYTSKGEFAPRMYEERPATILVLPPINNSTAADAKEYYITTIAEPLSNCGYYVLPTEVVNDILKQEGLFDTETMMNVPLEKFKEYFGADAVLFVTIEKWDTQFLLTSGSVTVMAICELKSTITGELLWFYDQEIEVNTSGDSGGMGGWAGLATLIITTAVETATQDYVPVARQVNEKILVTIPYGQYHPYFGQDKGTKIKKKDRPRK